MKIPVKLTQSLAFQKDLQSSPVQGSGVNELLSHAPFWRSKPFFSLNLVPFLVEIFRKISTCNFFYACLHVDEFSSEIRNEQLNPPLIKEIRSLELTLALVQVNREFMHG